MKSVKYISIILAVIFVIGCISAFAVTSSKTNQLLNKIDDIKAEKETIISDISIQKDKIQKLDTEKTKISNEIKELKAKLEKDNNKNNSSSSSSSTSTRKPGPTDSNSGPKICYLTFDDGPSSNTLKILDVLKKYNAKATFFVTGNASANTKKEVFPRIVAEGHAIGIHTYSHEYSEVYASEDAFFKDFYKIRDEIFNYTGVKTNLSRFPGGSNNTVSRKHGGKDIMHRLVDSVTEKGFVFFDWNVSSGDATSTPATTNQIINTVVKNSKNYNNAVVLCHDALAKKATAAAVEEIIIQLTEAGYEFRALTEKSFAPQFYKPQTK